MGHPANGTLYGATPYGGPQNLGTVFTLNQSLDHFIALVRYAGKTGSAVQILGQALAGTTSVTFNGVAATMFHVSSNTFMTAVGGNERACGGDDAIAEIQEQAEFSSNSLTDMVEEARLPSRIPWLLTGDRRRKLVSPDCSS